MMSTAHRVNRGSRKTYVRSRAGLKEGSVGGIGRAVGGRPKGK